MQLSVRLALLFGLLFPVCASGQYLTPGKTPTGSGSTPGLVTGDGTTITCVAGVCTANTGNTITDNIQAAGTTQGTCTALTTMYNRVTVTAVGTGVCLPAAVVNSRPNTFSVRNDGVNTLSVYPPNATSINGQAVGLPVQIAPSSSAQFIGSSATQIGGFFGPAANSRTAITSLYGVPATSPAAFYVATNGSDSNPGTVALPFLTLGQCQTAMRGAIQLGYGTSLAEPTCFIRAGTYAQTATISLDGRDFGETWSYYPPDGLQTASLTQNAAFAFFTVLNGADNITITGLKATGFQSSAHGACSGAFFINVFNSSGNYIRNFTATYNKGTTFDCGIFVNDVFNPKVSFNFIDTASYVGIGCDHCEGLSTQTVWEGNIVINVNNGGTPGVNAYGMIFSNNSFGTNHNMTASDNIVANSFTWECYDDHGGTNIFWFGNLCVGVGNNAGINEVALPASSSPTNLSIPLVNPQQWGNVVDGGSVAYNSANSFVMCALSCNSGDGGNWADIDGGIANYNIGMFGNAQGASAFSSPVSSTGNNVFSLSPNTVSSIGFAPASGSTSVSSVSFTHGLPGAVVATIQVNMAQSFWKFPVPPGSFSLTGANLGGFVICNNNQICQSSNGTAAGTFTDVGIIATLNGMSGSPVTQASGTLTLTGN